MFLVCLVTLVYLPYRYTDCAYLVLEYASGGDIHSYISRHGRIAEEAALRFILGEVSTCIVLYRYYIVQY